MLHLLGSGVRYVLRNHRPGLRSPLTTQRRQTTDVFEFRRARCIVSKIDAMSARDAANCRCVARQPGTQSQLPRLYPDRAVIVRRR
eukprot:348141-Prymnesium_polylepis.1